MLDLAYPYLLLLLTVIPVFVLIFIWARWKRSRQLQRFGRPAMLARLMPDVSRYKPIIKITLQMLALAAIIMVLTRPRFGEKDETQHVQGIEVVVCFDVSNSMLAASTDDAKSTSRLKRARLLLEKLIDKLGNDRVALVVFAGGAKVKMPMTTDFYSAKIFLQDLDPSLIPSQGTSISEALELSMRTFSDKKDVHKAIILITDAEDHEGKAIETAAAAAEKGIQVDVVGVGTSKGARIPLSPDGKQFMTDNEGREVVTAVDEQAAAEIAKAGKGVYVNGASPKALETLQTQLDKLAKSEFKQVRYKVSAEQFPIFAWLALILLVLDAVTTNTKSDWLRDVNFFDKKKKEQK